MLSELLFAAAFQIGPFYEQKEDAAALRPFWSTEGRTTDVVWPLFTSHDDWWRALFFLHCQTNDTGYQFEAMPLFWKGRARDEDYWGLFPLYGHHPHILLLHDIDFALWPVWMRYTMPRPSLRKAETDPAPQMRTNAVLWPFFHWRDDGSGGFWPLYVRNRQRESLHETVLWPIFTWARYEPDRDTGGAGRSWMFWPLCGGVAREREDQWMFIPPLFSVAKTRSRSAAKIGDGGVAETDGSDGTTGVRYRFPWPLLEYESTPRRDRFSFIPLYEHTTLKSYSSNLQPSTLNLQPSTLNLQPSTFNLQPSTLNLQPSTFNFQPSTSITRFGWKLVELYPDETRVFPFWVSRKDGSYFRLWPFWESERGEDGVTRSRLFALFPIRNVPAVDRNWAKFWTFYERTTDGRETEHSLFWHIIHWRRAAAR